MTARAPVISNLLKGKRGVFFGVANDRSIAWSIAKILSNHGAELAFTFQGGTNPGECCGVVGNASETVSSLSVGCIA